MSVQNETFQEFCIRVLGNVKPKATFLSVKGYKNNFNEVADFSVVFHVNYLNAVKKAQAIISAADYPGGKRFTQADFEAAKAELLASFKDTLSGYNPLYTCHGVYSEIRNKQGDLVPGAKLHIKQGLVHINALRVKKKVIVPGQYGSSNSSGKTLAKRYLRGLTPLANWVQFKLAPKRFEKLKVERMTIRG